jgi:integrase
MGKAVSYRMRATKDAKGHWQPDAKGKWQYVPINEGRGKRPEWLAFAAKQAANGGRGFLFRLRSGAWSEPIYRTIAAAREAANADSGKTPAQASIPGSVVGGLAIQIDKYLSEIQANKSHKTYLAYANSLVLFRESCRKSDVGDVNRSDILNFKLYLTNRKLDDGERISPRACFNNFLNVSVFFKWAGRSFISMGTKKSDWFPKPEREPEAYTEEEMNALFKAANDNERLVLKSFLNSGFRSGELAHLTYSDIDAQYSIWKVRPKTLVLSDGRREWKPKTQESQREVAVHPNITKKIMARKKALGASDNDLIFPNREGNPDNHLLRIVKRVAKKAKVTGRVDDHKFRSTAITLWLQDGNTVPDVMRWVGHVDPKTILRYAEKVNLRKDETRKRTMKTFDAFATMGD